MNIQAKLSVYAIQELVEEKFSKRNISSVIKNEILETDGIEEIIQDGISLLRTYRDTKYSYASKNARIEQLRQLSLRDIVVDVISVTLFYAEPVLFTQAVGRIAESLQFTNKGDGIKTSAEILAVLAALDLYDITKSDKYASLYICSNISPSEELTDFINQTKFLPPMVCQPNVLTKNTDSAYLTRREPLILGGHINHHNGDICLDSLNKFNQIPMSLDVELLKIFNDEPSEKIKADPKKLQQWYAMTSASYEVFLDLVKQGNKFYQTHGVDKRGRTYARGYHVSSQGNSFRKAILDFHQKEVVEGV